MILLLDLGNSRVKWAFADADLHDGGDLDWQHPAAGGGLLDHWQNKPPPERVLAAAVTTAKRRALLDLTLAKLDWPRAEWLQSPEHFAGLTSAYDQAADLGIDRFLAMLAAVDGRLAPCVIASCGTALTLDALAPDGRHLGGQIVPGVSAMLQALRRQAPGLPDAGGGQRAELAANTVDAIYSGAWHAVAGAIEHFQVLAEARMQQRPQLLLCGGHAAEIGKLLCIDAEQFPQAVLRGLLVWSRTPKL